ncbi:MAG: putative PhzF superfamily epimerase YddE/YHI9 [Colwellia sp.]|jgi:predicted PhzF superfamily epimerase YddE/YHI9
MELEINVIDAFTDVPFKGNLAAVIITNDWLSVEPSFRTNPELYNELILLI